MVDDIFSSSWHRVADLKPRLRGHAAIHRHVYRGQVWYVLQDPLTGTHYRFDGTAHFLIGLLNGRRSVAEVWDAACDRLGDDAPTQDETIEVLARLHSADVLQTDIAPDTLELFRRTQRHGRAKVLERLASPFSVRLPLVDPDRFLARWIGLVKPLFSPAAAAAWLLCVLVALVLTGLHWSQLSHDFAERALAPKNLLVLALTYPLVKSLHELGHAFATKVWGGAVHEMGVVFLVFVPVPYVDASASNAFPARHRRMIVGAAGIVVELLLASLALFLWLAAEPGWVRDLAFNVMLIGGVSSLFFNGNPLLRFDGYYVLADALDIPNLATRSRRYLIYLVQRHLFGLRDGSTPVQAPGESGWLLSYAVGSFLYRLLILFAIALFVSSEFPVAGVVLATWGVGVQLILPILKGIRFLLVSPRLARRRFRALLSTGAVLGSALALVFALPVTSWTIAEGVVWLPESAQVRAGTEGFVREVLVESDSWVEAGQAIVACEDPTLEAQVRVLEAQLSELRLRYRHERATSISAAQLVEEEMRAIESELRRTEERREALTISAPVEGRFVAHRPQDLPGRFLQQGEVVGYVVDGPSRTVRVVVPQSEADLVNSYISATEVRLAYKAENLLLGDLARALPSATDRLPAKSLGTSGGGSVPVDPLDEEGLRSEEKMFQFDVALPEGAPAYYFGQRAHVRFEHGEETLAAQWYRSLRQLFLAKFES